MNNLNVAQLNTKVKEGQNFSVHPRKSDPLSVGDGLSADVGSLSLETTDKKSNFSEVNGVDNSDAGQYCHSSRGLIDMWATEGGWGGGIVRAQLCGLWGCPYCGKRKIKKIRRSLIKELHKKFDSVSGGGNPWHYLKLLTLTADTKSFKSPIEAHDAMMLGWNKLRTAIQRVHGKVEYVMIKEKHVSGYPHLHILMWVKAYIEQSWISDMWSKYDIGRIVDIRCAPKPMQSITHAVNYVTKYMLKGLTEDIPWFRRWSRSRNMMPPLYTKVKGWWQHVSLRWDKDIVQMKADYESFGYDTFVHPDRYGFDWLGKLQL